ncbi:HNH endonuclease signature motif containing protein [Hymenobacter ruricola]|uniref:HNH endonuclease n=1 Tax=Hymenobacter ruricola TaxID=2791023 RepID=A0ABS0I7R3_9BACT|nr:HNH endonuclease signature motif containing protein [Hymenobacter ruricola]MBF9222965.1 HNH endonuclease [Hymenobacter ruricola]
MRPVERGPIPVLADGTTKTVKDYKDWRFDLINQIGKYCSYCNMPLYDSPQVEHVAPKSPVPGLALAWDNMLLACGACNSIKNDRSCSSATHFLPDYHNTHLAFAQAVRSHRKLPASSAAVVVPRPGLPALKFPKASATIALCGLARVEQTATQMRRASDLRWLYRFEACELATRYRAAWDALPAAFEAQFLACLHDLARAIGFFSVWFDSFYDVVPVKQMLIGAFPHTANCFPAPSYDPVVRVTGDL